MCPIRQAVASVTVGTDNQGDGGAEARQSLDQGDLRRRRLVLHFSAREEQEAFFPPVVTDRHILAIEFTPQGQVANIRHYGLQDGRVVDYVTRETPTRGKELTILQQMFNAVPGVTGAQARSPASTARATKSGELRGAVRPRRARAPPAATAPRCW